MYKIFTRKEKVNSQLHHKQECCALPRKQPIDHALSGGGDAGDCTRNGKRARSDVTAFLGEAHLIFLFGKTPTG